MHELAHLQQLGCTFCGCFQRFETIYHWKKHESELHFQDEEWCCQISIPGRSCAMVSKNMKDHRRHLEDQHAIFETEVLNTRCQDDKLSRQWAGSYWCGFCQKVLASKNIFGGLMTTERYDHIISHIQDGKSIEDWLEPGGKTKAQAMTVLQTEDGAFNPWCCQFRIRFSLDHH